MDKRVAASDDDEDFPSDQEAAGDDKSVFSVSDDEDGAQWPSPKDTVRLMKFLLSVIRRMAANVFLRETCADVRASSKPEADAQGLESPSSSANDVCSAIVCANISQCSQSPRFDAFACVSLFQHPACCMLAACAGVARPCTHRFLLPLQVTK